MLTVIGKQLKSSNLLQSRKYGDRTNVSFLSHFCMYHYATTNCELLIGLDHLREENQ